MKEFSEADLDKLAKLCRIACSAEEKKALRAQLASVLGYIQQLDEVNTEGVLPCYRVNEAQENVMREDLAGPTLPRQTFLDNAPSHVGGMIRVPPIIKSDNRN